METMCLAFYFLLARPSDTIQTRWSSVGFAILIVDVPVPHNPIKKKTRANPKIKSPSPQPAASVKQDHFLYSGGVHAGILLGAGKPPGVHVVVEVKCGWFQVLSMHLHDHLLLTRGRAGMCG